MIPGASRAVSAFRSRFKASVFYLVPWAVVPATDVFLKIRVLRNGGLDKAAIAMGRSRESFTFAERIAFLRGDLLVSCLVIPVAILCLAYFLPDRLRWLGMWCLALLAFVAELVLFTQYGTFLSIGHFANFVVIWEGTKWWYAHPESTAGTPAKRLVISLVIAAVVVLVSTVVATYLSRKPEGSIATWMRRGLLVGGIAVILATLLVIWIPNGNVAIFHGDLLATMSCGRFTGKRCASQSIANYPSISVKRGTTTWCWLSWRPRLQGSSIPPSITSMTCPIYDGCGSAPL
jgi:hypothetical protein